MTEAQQRALAEIRAANESALRWAPRAPVPMQMPDLRLQSGEKNNVLTQLGVGVDNLQASLQRSIAGANTLLGNEDTAFTRSLMESAELNSRNAAAANFIPDSIPGAALAYTAQATPGIAAMAAGGWAGLGAKAAGGLAARALGVTLPEVAGAGAAAGLTGATLANLPQHYGENINAQIENGATLGEASTGAIAPALINTGLDTASTVIGLGALSKAAKPYRDAGMSTDEAFKQAAKDLRGSPAKAVAMGTGAVGVEAGTEGAQQAVTLSMDPNSPFAFMDPGYNAKVGDAAYAGALAAGTIQSPGIAVNAARALAPTPAVNETPQTGTVDVVDPSTGAVLGSSTGELGSNNDPLMSADFAAMNEAADKTVQYPNGEDPLLSAIRDDMGGRAVTINPIAENYLVHNLGITPTDAVSALSAVAPDEVENRTWSSDAVLQAASKIMEQQAQAQRDATIPTDGITEQDAIQGLLGQLQQAATKADAEWETRQPAVDESALSPSGQRQTIADFPNLQRLDAIKEVEDKITELEAKKFGDLLKPFSIDPIIANADIPKATKTKLLGASVEEAVAELTALATKTIPKYKKSATELAAKLPEMVTAAESTRTAKLTAARNEAAKGNDALAQQYRILASLTAEPEPAPQPPKAEAPKRTTKAKAAQPAPVQPVPKKSYFTALESGVTAKSKRVLEDAAKNAVASGDVSMIIPALGDEKYTASTRNQGIYPTMRKVLHSSLADMEQEGTLPTIGVINTKLRRVYEAGGDGGHTPEMDAMLGSLGAHLQEGLPFDSPIRSLDGLSKTYKNIIPALKFALNNVSRHPGISPRIVADYITRVSKGENSKNAATEAVAVLRTLRHVIDYPEDYIAESARVLEEVIGSVLLPTNDVVNSKDAAGIYDANSNNIGISRYHEDSNHTLSYIVLHELAHAITLGKVPVSTEHIQQLEHLMGLVRNRFYDPNGVIRNRYNMYRRTNVEYGLSSWQEFLAVGLTDESMMELMLNTPVDGDKTGVSILDKFVELAVSVIRKLTGHNTVLEEFLRIVSEIKEANKSSTLTTAPQPPKAKTPKRTTKAKTTDAQPAPVQPIQPVQPVQPEPASVQQTSGLEAMTDEQLVAEAAALRKEADEFGLTTSQEKRLTDLRNEFAARKEAASRKTNRGYNDPTLELDDTSAGLNLSNDVQTERLDTGGFSAIRATTPRNALGRAPTYAQMRARIRNIASRFLHLPRVKIIPTFMAAPQSIIDRAKQEGHDGSAVKGFFHEGEIYVVQDKVESLLSLEKTVFHEGFHLGLRQSGDGSQVVAMLHNAVNALGGLDGIINLAKRQGTYDRLEPYLAGWADKVARGESTQNQANWMLLEETLAPLAEKQQNVKLSLFTKARKAFADLLRTLGFDAMADKLESGSGDLMAYYVMEAANRGLNNDPKGTANAPARYKAESQGFSVQPATKQPEGKRPPRRVLAAAMDALNGFLSRSGFGLGAYAMLAGSVSVVRTVSPEIADRMQEALRRAKEWMRVSTNSVLGTLNRGFDTYKMSDDDKIRTANYVSGEMTLDQIAAQVGKDSGIYKTVVETRAALRAVYEKYVQPAFLHRAIIDITNARDQAAKLDSKAGANVMAKAFSKHFKRVEGESLAAATARGKSLFIIGQDGLPKKTTTIPEGTTAFVMKHDRGSTHFPRVFDYDRIIGDKEGFIKQVLSAKDVDGKPFMESRKEAETLYNTLAANPDSYKQQDFLVRHETVGATRTGREMERAINLPNYVFGDYIIRDVGRSVPVYMQQLMNSAAFIDEFGAITHDSDGNVSINESSNDIANMLNGIPDIAVRQKVKRAVDAMFNPNFQTTRWGREMRLVASVAQFAAALAYMPLIVLSSFPEVANHIAAGRTKLERDVAKKVIWKTITNVFSESGRASNAMMRHRLEALGVINAEIVEHAMHGISQAQEMMGLEGKVKGAMGSFYQRSGITRFTSFQELLAGTIATEVMLTANKVLSDPETSASEKQQAVGTLARATGINPEQYAKLSKAEREALAKDMSAKLSLWQKASDEAGKELNPLDVVDADPALVAATDAVHKAINVGVGIRVAHANAGDVPFYFNDPIFKVVGQFKRFFYGATANVLPNMTANFLDGEWKDARDQFLWFAGVGMSAAAIGLMASHAVKYAAVAGVTGDPQTPFSVWQHKDDFASNLAAESALYATSGLVAATPYVGMMERPGGLLEPLNWAASAGLMTTVANNPISLVDNAGMAAAVWLGGDMIAKRMDNKYKSNLDKANQLGYKGRYTEGL